MYGGPVVRAPCAEKSTTSEQEKSKAILQPSTGKQQQEK